MDLIMEANTKYITILRNPVDHFESTFNYMEFYRYFGLPRGMDSLEKFLTKPHEYLATKGTLSGSLNLVRNGMLFDLGLHTSYHDNETAIGNTIQKIDDDFALVLLTDYYDESLVLLKRELCWDLDDIVYVKLNQRRNGDKVKKTHKKNLEDAIRRWNWADVLLYQHFNRTFWKKIREHGDGFYEDLENFRRKNQEMYRQCVAPVEVEETAFGLTGKIRGFQLNENVSTHNRYLCLKILTNEIDYINYFRQKFHPHYGYREQLIKEGLTQPNASEELAKRLEAVSAATKEYSS